MMSKQVNDIEYSFELLEERFVRWAAGEDNVRAAVVIGSRARQDHPADEWSDLDILFFARDVEIYTRDTTWVMQMGEPWLAFSEMAPDGRGFERRVLYDGGLDVDFVPGSARDLEYLVDHELPPDLADMISRGVRILIDKDGHLEKLTDRHIPPPIYSFPSEEEFLNAVHDFWYHTVWTAKKLRRGELWWGKSCCDSYLKELLRQMLEWHARADRGAATDTWMRGRFLEEWVDPRVAVALPELFAHYDETDIWRALLVTMSLYHWLTAETAVKLGYHYPQAGKEKASAFVEMLYQGSR